MSHVPPVLPGQAVEGEILYALSSCCPAESMKLTGTNDVHVTCELPMNESCHYMASMKDVGRHSAAQGFLLPLLQDYAALRRSIDGIVQTLGDELQCEGLAWQDKCPQCIDAGTDGG